MTIQERIARLHDNTLTLAAAFLEPSKDKRGFVCPCGHGSGAARKGGEKNTGDGLTFTAGGRWHCFACGHKGDIIELYQYKHGVDFKTALAELEAIMGFLPPAEKPKQQQKKQESFPLTAPYRGISPETLARFGVMRFPDYVNPKGGARLGDCVVFPTGEGSCFVRGAGNIKRDVGPKRPFNLEALRSGRPVFVVEGVIDALSIIEAGGEAVGLSGVDGIGAFIEALKEAPSPSGLLLAGDNDKAGRAASETWAEKIAGVGVSCRVLDSAALFGDTKDANEALQADAAGFAARIAGETAKEAEARNPWAAGVSELVRSVEAGAYTPIASGISCIDKLLGGGFVSKQLVIIGAAPGMGKTAMAQWFVETMAMNNPDFSAMYFCFEMAREQLQARSIARLLHEQGKGISSLEVLQGRFGWREGVELYADKVAGKVAYFGLGSGLHSSNLDEVLRIMQDGIKYTTSKGRPAPFIVVDYLQLVSVEGKEEQEAVKLTIERLKEFAVKNSTVVIGIVANNRESNKAGGVSMYSGRGSSSIEYGADVVLGLAYTEALDKREEVEHKNRRSLVMTKGRFYQQDARADFDFIGASLAFVPVESMGREVSKKQAREINNLLQLPAR